MDANGFLHQALLYLGAGIVAVPLFKRLGLGSVLGYLVAGMAIGPWGAGLISEARTVLHIAELGVVLLLFLVGLELNPRRVWGMRRAIFGLGGAQVAATAGALAVIVFFLSGNWGTAAVAGMGMAMSSTAIGLATLAEKNLLATPGGQASFAVLLFQDLAVVPMLIVLGLLTGAGKGMDAGDAAAALAVVVALLAGGRYLVRPVLRYIAETRLREVFVAFALFLVLGTAALMASVGLSMALGAFLAGVILADSEYRHELELDIEPFKGLLLGLFFIAVGMSVDLGLLLRSPLLVLGLAAGLVAVKALILFALARAFGYCDRADAGLFAASLSQGGEFAFIVFAAAASLVPAETLGLLNAVVAISMLTTPFLLMAFSRVSQKPAPVVASERIEEANPVIVAGFGRFGQVAVRVLRGLGIGATVIDHDPAQIETVRRFGFKAYYGDATRMDLLRQAGAARAKMLIVAIDDPQSAMALVKKARATFPHLELVGRARGRTDAYEYAELGVPAVREVFGSALQAAALALEKLGYAADDAKRLVETFRAHDEAQVAANAHHRHDIEKLIALTEQGRRDIAQLLAQETGNGLAGPDVDERDAQAHQERGDGKPAGQRL